MLRRFDWLIRIGTPHQSPGGPAIRADNLKLSVPQDSKSMQVSAGQACRSTVTARNSVHSLHYFSRRSSNMGTKSTDPPTPLASTPHCCSIHHRHRCPQHW